MNQGCRWAKDEVGGKAGGSVADGRNLAEIGAKSVHFPIAGHERPARRHCRLPFWRDASVNIAAPSRLVATMATPQPEWLRTAGVAWPEPPPYSPRAPADPLRRSRFRRRIECSTPCAPPRKIGLAASS